MAPTALIVRSVTILFSLLLIAMSITALYTSGDATRRLARDFPPGRYAVSYGPVNADWKTNTTSEWEFGYKVVRLEYETSTEKWTWAAAAFGLVVGLASVAVEMVGAWRRRKVQDGNTAITSTVFSVTAIVIPTIAFVISLVASVYGKVQRQKVAEGTCNWEAGVDYDKYEYPEPARDLYTCTRELAACTIIGNFYDGPMERETSCMELKLSRHALISLTIFSAIVALGYGAQMWLGKRQGSEAIIAEERVRRLQDEEED